MIFGIGIACGEDHGRADQNEDDNENQKRTVDRTAQTDDGFQRLLLFGGFWCALRGRRGADRTACGRMLCVWIGSGTADGCIGLRVLCPCSVCLRLRTLCLLVRRRRISALCRTLCLLSLSLGRLCGRAARICLIGVHQTALLSSDRSRYLY